VKARLTAIAAATGLMVWSTISAADVAAHFYCGGAVQYFANGWWIHRGPAGNVGELSAMPAPPAACPSYSSEMTYPGGLGSQSPLPSSPPPSGGTIDGSSVFYSMTPQQSFGAVGLLGQILGRLFAGPEYSPTSQDMNRELERIRSYSHDMVTALKSDTSYARSQVPAQTSWARADSDKQRSVLKAGRDADSLNANQLETAINARPTPPPVVPQTNLGAVLELLEQRKNIAEISNAIPPENLRLSGPSMYGTLDGARSQAGDGKTQLEQEEDHELAKLTAAIAKTGSSSSHISPLFVRAQATLATARQFSQDVTPAALAIAGSLLVEARSERFAAVGVSRGQTAVAVVNADGSVALHPRSSAEPVPANSLVEDAAAFASAQSVARSDLGNAQTLVEERSGSDRERGRLLLRMSQSLFDNAGIAYFSGQLGEGKALAASAIYVMGIAANDQSPHTALLNPETRQEAIEFAKSLFLSSFDAAQDNTVGEMGKILTGIEDLDAVSGMLRDFSSFNGAIVEYVQHPTSENKEKVAELALKFNFALTGESAVAAAVAAGTLSVGWGIVAGLAVSVAADHAARAMIMQGLEKHPVNLAPVHR
jgi:hypothetical protein